MRLLFLLCLFCISPLFLTAGDATTPTIITPEQRPFLGVNVDENAASFDPEQGLPLTAIIPGSSAAAMGLQVGDLLKGFNGKPIRSQDDLRAAIRATKVGDDITVDVLRKEGETLTPKTMKGIIAVRPQVGSINKDLAQLRQEMLRLRQAQKNQSDQQLSLADMLKMLKEIEDNMPAAVAEFKKQYPNGEFNIHIKIDIVSDKTAKDPITIGNQPGTQLGPDQATAPVEKESAPEPAPKP